MDETEKLDLRSHNLSDDKKQELLRLFPETRTEGGKIDFECLKLALGEMVDVGKERYGMNWPGKADCFKTIQSPSLGTLRPCPEESVNFDTTENLIIEGDNLEVLKLLQKSYLGKVKMIYIDPPYNTGNDFIYPDNYTESLQTYLEFTGQVDSTGKKFNTNTEADGRFHSKWLNMMYPRLFLARNLLRQDGVIFVSIDDGELDNLKKICNEIFGEENLIAVMPWKGRGGRQASEHLAGLHEFVLLYARSASEFLAGEQVKEDETFPKYDPIKERRYKITLLRKWGNAARRQDRRNMYYGIPAPDGTEAYPKLPDGSDGRWRWEQPNAMKALQNGDLEFIKDGNSWVVYEKTYEPKEGEVRTKKYTTWLDDVGNTANGTDRLKEMFETPPFDFPKPPSLIERLIHIAGTIDRTEDFIVMDYFAGSGTTADAVLHLNWQDKGARSYILVQLPEPCNQESIAYKAGFKTITDVCKERVRRVIKNLSETSQGELPLEGEHKQDLGFRVFKLAESNFKVWNANIPTKDVSALQQQLELHIDHIREGRTPDDILYEILLKSGFPVTTPVEKLTIEGTTVFSVAGRALFICLERNLTLDLIRGMAAQKPERVVCLDEGFAGNDQLKANAVQIFKTKGVTSFKTV